MDAHQPKLRLANWHKIFMVGKVNKIGAAVTAATFPRGFKMTPLLPSLGSGRREGDRKRALPAHRRPDALANDSP